MNYRLHKYTKDIYIPVLSILFIIPIFLWLGDNLDGFKTGPDILGSLGKVTGILGTMMFSAGLILSGRIKFLENIFGGLPNMYNIHHELGIYGFLIICLHPVFLALKLSFFSFELAARFLLPFDNSNAVIFGMIALYSMMALLCVTIFGSIFKYDLLKKIHRFLGIAFMFGVVHAYMIPSDIESNLFLRIYVLGFALIGVFVYIYNSFLKRFFNFDYYYLITNVKSLNDTVCEITAKPAGKYITPLPGQFAFIKIIDKNITGEEHPFTMSGYDKDTKEITFTIKNLGDFTQSIKNISIDSMMIVDGPYGDFSYKYHKKNQLWIAGGVGVTPFIAMIKNMIKENIYDHDIDFYYSVNEEKELLYTEEISTLKEKNVNFKFHPILTKTDGFLTLERIIAKTENVYKKEILICGPPVMMSAFTKAFEKYNIKDTYSEKFSMLK